MEPIVISALFTICAYVLIEGLWRMAEKAQEQREQRKRDDRADQRGS